MALAEILSEARRLSRPEQLRLIQELTAGLRSENDDEVLIEPGRDYAIWSPHAAYEAADILLKSLSIPESPQ